MPDCTPAQITIGGALTPYARVALADAIDNQDVGSDYGDAALDFDGALAYIDRAIGRGDTILLSDDNASWGQFSEVEPACKALGLRFHRTNDAKYDVEAEALFFDGKTEVSFASDKSGTVLVELAHVVAAFEGGTIEEWLASKTRAAFIVPPLTYHGPSGMRSAYCTICDQVVIPTGSGFGTWEHFDKDPTHDPEVDDEGALVQA